MIADYRWTEPAPTALSRNQEIGIPCLLRSSFVRTRETKCKANRQNNESTRSIIEDVPNLQLLVPLQLRLRIIIIESEWIR